MSGITVYIAGSIDNKSKIKNLMGEIESWGHNIAVDWTKHQEKGKATQYAKEDLKGLKDCDCLIYCMDRNRSRGKNFELGYITALGKPIVIYIMDENEDKDKDFEREKLSIDSLIDNECIFIRAKLFPIIDSKEELRLWLDNLDVKLLLSRTRQKQMEE